VQPEGTPCFGEYKINRKTRYIGLALAVTSTLAIGTYGQKSSDGVHFADWWVIAGTSFVITKKVRPSPPSLILSDLNWRAYKRQDV
jgi:hypothetical protein